MNPLYSSRLIENKMVKHSIDPTSIYKICWMIENNSDNNKPNISIKSTKQFYVPIATSSTGKTTFFSKFSSDHVIINLDDVKNELYSENGKYNHMECFHMANADELYQDIIDQLLTNAFSDGGPVIWDNVVINKFDRMAIIKKAKEFGYQTNALTFPIDLDTLKTRFDKRPVKTVSFDLIENQYMHIEQPSYSEFDFIIPINII